MQRLPENWLDNLHLPLADDVHRVWEVHVAEIGRGSPSSVGGRVGVATSCCTARVMSLILALHSTLLTSELGKWEFVLHHGVHHPLLCQKDLFKTGGNGNPDMVEGRDAESSSLGHLKGSPVL